MAPIQSNLFRATAFVQPLTFSRGSNGGSATLSTSTTNTPTVASFGLAARSHNVGVAANNAEKDVNHGPNCPCCGAKKNVCVCVMIPSSCKVGCPCECHS